MQAKRHSDQLPLWEEEAEPANNPVGIISPQAQEPESTSVEAMRAYIMQWGEKNGYPGFGFAFVFPPKDTDADRRFGAMYRGREMYVKEIARPKLQSRYDGEWEERCIEQIRRYDAGICEKLWLWLPEYVGMPKKSKRSADDEDEE